MILREHVCEPLCAHYHCYLRDRSGNYEVFSMSSRIPIRIYNHWVYETYPSLSEKEAS